MIFENITLFPTVNKLMRFKQPENSLSFPLKPDSVYPTLTIQANSGLMITRLY